MNMVWHTTTRQTRVFLDSDSCYYDETGPEIRFVRPKRYGHVRNAGNKIWHAEYYDQKLESDLGSLKEAKDWVEAQHKLKYP